MDVLVTSVRLQNDYYRFMTFTNVHYNMKTIDIIFHGHHTLTIPLFSSSSEHRRMTTHFASNESP